MCNYINVASYTVINPIHVILECFHNYSNYNKTDAVGRARTMLALKYTISSFRWLEQYLMTKAIIMCYGDDSKSIVLTFLFGIPSL